MLRFPVNSPHIQSLLTFLRIAIDMTCPETETARRSGRSAALFRFSVFCPYFFFTGIQMALW